TAPRANIVTATPPAIACIAAHPSTPSVRAARHPPMRGIFIAAAAASGTRPRFAGESAEEQRDTARGGDRQEGRGPSRQVVPAGESERRTVTILFADIAGFTSLSEKLDPEDVTTLMNGCLKMLADIVVRYEGYVDKFIGDCVMAVFGPPIAHENHPELAVRTALTMRQEMERFNERLPVKIDKDLALHIGINSGLVIAGNVGSDAK